MFARPVVEPRSRAMRRLLSCFSRFWSNRRGNVAIIFALAIVPVMGSIGAAVDYSFANASRTAMQAALDNTALDLSKQMPLSQTNLNTIGWEYFTGNLGTTPVVITSSNLTINAATNNQLVLDVSGTYTLGLGGVLKLVGVNPSFIVRAHSEVQWGNSRLRVALVLDNTGSMSQSNKIGALKTATTNLITQLQNAANVNGDVYISIIPFVNTVNVNSSNYTASWIDWYDWEHNSYNQNSGSCSVSGNSSQSSCNSAGTCSVSGHTTQSTCIAAGTCSLSQWTTKSKCQSKGGTWTAGVWTAATWTFDHSTWNGCLTDRGTPLNYSGYTGPGTGAGNDQNISAPSANAESNPANAPDSSKFPAEPSNGNTSACPLQMMGLTYDWTALKNLVNLMTPNGTTNQPIGLVWGWQSLVGGGPLTSPAMDPNYTYNQVIILLTDGLNTQDRWYGDGSTTSTQVDARMYSGSGSTATGTCQNIKAAGITIYTVQVDTGGDPTSTLLQNCASDPTKFFILTSSSQIVTTFQQIGTALANLHLSQ
jgi:Flp pilus assembly protein TadG